jgi:quinol monooxygenase YgiN
MILVHMRITASTRQRREILRTLRALTPSTASRRGCADVRILQEVDNHNSFLWVEQWDSEADLDRHVRSDEYRALLTVIDMSMRQPDIRFFHVDKIAGMEMIAEKRAVDGGIG